jgi:hypothetical protein
LDVVATKGGDPNEVVALGDFDGEPGVGLPDAAQAVTEQITMAMVSPVPTLRPFISNLFSALGL